MQLKHARQIAEEIVTRLSLSCLRVEIAGSVRREKSDCGDIEIVCIPRFIDAPQADLFGDTTVKQSALVARLGQLAEDGFLRSRPAEANGERYKKMWVMDGAREIIQLDLFIVNPPEQQWGAVLAIRTGSSDFSKWLVTPKRQGGAMPSYLKQKGGALWRVGKGEPDVMIATPEEIDYFNALGIEYVEPRDRSGGRWVRVAHPSPTERLYS